MEYGFLALCLMAVFGLAACNTCVNPQISETSFTTRDSAVVTHIAFITEFSIKCDNSLPKDFALYAEVEGRTMPAARIRENRYQVSWSEEQARGGQREVRLHGEEGYTALRKAMRSGEDPANVASLQTLTLTYNAGYNGPWINSEVMAAIMSIFVGYIAISNKSRLLA